MDTTAAHLDYFTTIYFSLVFKKKVFWPFWRGTQLPHPWIPVNTHTRARTHTRSPILIFKQCVNQLCVCVTGDKAGLLWDKEALADRTRLRMTGRRHNPLLQIPQEAPVPDTPCPSTSLPPYPTGLATDTKASPKTASFANWLLQFFIVVSKVCSYCSFCCSYHDMV